MAQQLELVGQVVGREGKTRYRVFFFFFNDTATTEIYTSLPTLSLHDALPILTPWPRRSATRARSLPSRRRSLPPRRRPARLGGGRRDRQGGETYAGSLSPSGGAAT